MPLVLQSSQHTLIPNTSVVVPKDNTFHLGDNECGPCTPPHSPNPQITLASKDAPSHNDTTAAPTTPPPSRSNTYNKRPALKQDSSTKYYTADDLRNLSVQEQTTSHTNELASNEADPALRATVLNGPSTQPDTNVPSTRHAEMEPTNRDILHPLEYVNSIDNGLLEHHNNSSTLSKSYSYQRRSSLHSRALHRRSTTMAIENLDPDERAALEAEIAARRAARRASQRKRKTYADTDDEEDKVVIGVRIGEGHQNYQLMYDMLTGIRVAVSRVSAKINRPLADEDFKAAHKLVFDVTGNELTPGVKYDFKFKDYAPWVFRNLREKFHVDAADYLMSLTNKYILSELTSPGKSGSFFYYSRDYRFIIKTIHYTEHRFLRKVLKDYYEHVCQNPNTLLSRFYGLHRIKLPHGSKIHFIVMGNVFPANKDIHTSFDLKGSTYGRLTPEEKRKNKHAVLKDQNWLEQKERLQLGPTKRRIFLEQLEKDVKLLIRLNIMDYSLLIGIHDTRRGNSENIRDNHLQVVEPNAERLERQLSVAGTIRKESRANIVRKALKQASPVQLDTSELPGTPGEERRYCYFYAEDGGLKATDEDDRETLLLYFLGVIDILTPYNFKKKIEHLWKSLTQDKHTISSVPADEYGERFLQFMRDAVEPKPKSS